MLVRAVVIHGPDFLVAALAAHVRDLRLRDSGRSAARASRRYRPQIGARAFARQRPWPARDKFSAAQSALGGCGRRTKILRRPDSSLPPTNCRTPACTRSPAPQPNRQISLRPAGWASAVDKSSGSQARASRNIPGPPTTRRERFFPAARGAGCRTANSGTATRALATPRPVPVLNQSCAAAGPAAPKKRHTKHRDDCKFLSHGLCS